MQRSNSRRRHRNQPARYHRPFDARRIRPHVRVHAREGPRRRQGHLERVLKYKLTYEIMKPEDIGIPSNKLVMGKHSGRHAFVNRLKELGVDTETVDVNRAFGEFKALCDKKKIVYDDDILALINEETRRTADHFELLDVRVTSSAKTTPHAE